MTWVKLDDQFFTHPKALAAGRDGRALFIAGLCYCTANYTDGDIPKPALPILAAMAGVKPSAARQIVAAGFWDEEPDRYIVHDYLEYQPSSDTMIDRRSELSRKRAEAGRKGAAQRWQPDSNTHDKEDGKPIATGVANEKQTDGPVPSRPQLSSSSNNSQGLDPPAGGAEPPDDEKIWEILAERRANLEHPDGHGIRNRRQYLDRLRRDHRDRLTPQADELRHRHPDWPAERLADELDPDSAPVHPNTRALQAATQEHEQRMIEAEQRAAADPVTPEAYEAARQALRR